MQLLDDITNVKGVGPALARNLKQLGIRTVYDLIDYLPMRYEDYSEVLAVDSLRPGPVTVKVCVAQVNSRYVRRGMHITEATMSDDTGSVRVVWFNQPYRANALRQGQEYYVSGTYELARQRFQILNPSAELVKDFPVNTARIVPVYRQSKLVSTNQIRKLVAACVDMVRVLPETLPSWIITEVGLLSRAKAFEAMHFPGSAAELAAARRRLGFEEVLELTLASLLNKQESMRENAISIPFDVDLARKFVAGLPFELTDDQRRVVWQAYQDMEHRYPMNRLVEGDVGSGKTVVAAMVALMAMRQGYQVAFMAPTEILARQHAETLSKLLSSVGEDGSILLLVGGMTNAQKKSAHTAIAKGRAKLLVGTHALFQEKVDMKQLGLIIVDEQHRFGVEQRKSLMAKAGHMPHVLSLTATPIPRSLALTLYGELDISRLKQKPQGRQAIATKIVSATARKTMYEQVAAEIAAGRQVFVVCPLIAESDALAAASAEKVYEELQKNYLKSHRLALLHGKMKAEDKDRVMQQFAAGQLDVLVATTVIEVGVDVPNASVMIIESAERFGLAQLHQLRGRVGRGGHAAYCYLVLGDDKLPSKRLRAVETSQDGFRLAELDLEIRGPGAIYGAMQHGALDLRVVQLSDTALLAAARSVAQMCVDRSEDLLQYPELYTRVDRLRRVTNLN
ncbi:ATP-dependent DNA helicase RecG [Candidatus Saccharibacteria bacterium]|nr:ATP-dependent DNA helicase RecG [Candidatus Saccharibacteria bacterium]